MEISIITVTYNSDAFLTDYFQSINQQKFSNLEIIIVDCGSSDNTVEKIKALAFKYKYKLKLIETTNIGFAKGNNLGAKNARGRHLFFLNPDTRLEKHSLQYLYNKIKNIAFDDFILIPRQKNYQTKKFLLDGVCVDIFGYPFKIFNADHPEKTKSVFFCDGAALFIPKETFIKLDMFDEGMFMINEDVDLSWKAHLLRIPFFNVPTAVVYHFSGGSMTGGVKKGKVYRTTYQRRYLGERNAIRNILKNYSLLTLLWLFPIYLVVNFIEIIVFFLFFQYKVVYQYLKAWWWNSTNLSSTLTKRKFVQTKRVVTDREILRSMYLGSGKLNAFLSIKIPRFQ